MLPGLASGAVMALSVALSHLLLKRHVSRLTQQQTGHLDGVTEQQTRALSAGRMPHSEQPDDVRHDL
jgi:hypothetical protein